MQGDNHARLAHGLNRRRKLCWASCTGSIKAVSRSCVISANHRKEVDPAGVYFAWRAAMRAIRSAFSGAIRVSISFENGGFAASARRSARSVRVLFVAPQHPAVAERAVSQASAARVSVASPAKKRSPVPPIAPESAPGRFQRRGLLHSRQCVQRLQAGCQFSRLAVCQYGLQCWRVAVSACIQCSIVNSICRRASG